MIAASGENERNTVPQTAGRRWAVVALGDIVGYSILMSADEEATHAHWLMLMKQLIEPSAVRHGGQVIGFRGDGIAAEFTDAANAVGWAMEVQAELQRLNLADIAAQTGASTPIALRIGLHVGSIMGEAGSIAGDVVNVAARLQDQSQPGGIILSNAVYDGLPAALQRRARNLGALELRHMPRDMHCYGIDQHTFRVALPLPRPPAHKLPSVAVLPFYNLDGAGQDDYFADGIVEDIIVSLASLRELFVIARTSTLMFRGAQPDARYAGRALGVRYVLLGSVRRGRQIRINLQLIDALTGGTVWVDRIDLAREELFAVQDQIVLKVVAGIAPSVHAAELQRIMRRPPESLGAYDHWLRALHAMNTRDRETFETAKGHLEAAMLDDPGFAMPAAWLARWYSIYIGQGWSHDIAADAARCGELAQIAIGLDPRNALALATAGHQQAYLMHNCEAALSYLDQAVAACPNSSVAWTLSSGTMSYLGRGEEAVRQAEQGRNLSPLDQQRSFNHAFLCMAHYVRGTYEDAARWARLAISENPKLSTSYRTLIVSLSGLQRFDEAREAARHLLEIEPGFRLLAYEKTRLPFVPAMLRAQCMRHLREAGLPD